MVLVGFSMFHDAVKFGNKRQTIRKLRKRPIRIGDRLDLYWKPRSKQVESFGSWTCTETFYVRFFWESGQIQVVELVGENRTIVPQHFMRDAEALDLAKRDGFTSAQELFDALERMHGKPDDSQIWQVIRW